MRIFTYILATFITMMQLISCSSTPTKRNAELVVTYEGKEVHRASPRYKTLTEFTRYTEDSEKKYIIFGADWCGECKLLYKAIKQAGQFDKVAVVNVEEPWAAKLFGITKLNIIPAMVVVQNGKGLLDVKVGPSQIVMYLLLNLE